MSRRTGSRLPVAERTAAEIRELAPWVKPRQVEYWVDKGYIVPEGPPVQGHPRVFSDREKRVLRLLARLTRARIPARMAADAARTAVVIAEEADLAPGAGAVRVPLGDGIYLTIPGA